MKPTTAASTICLALDKCSGNKTPCICGRHEELDDSDNRIPNELIEEIRLYINKEGPKYYGGGTNGHRDMYVYRVFREEIELKIEEGLDAALTKWLNRRGKNGWQIIRLEYSVEPIEKSNSHTLCINAIGKRKR